MKNNLSESYPHLISEWSEKNLPLTPEDISYGSNRLVWWKGKCGHEWQASPHTRTNKKQSGCPYCSSNKILPGFNDLASQYPDVAAEWSDKNLPLTPDKVTPFRNKKAWWKGKCGHEWHALISSRSAGHGCPYCNTHKVLKGFNDLKTLHPKLAAEWSDKNLPLTPDQVPENRAGLFWWKCNTCGGEYRAWIESRIKNGKCPYCSGRKIQQGLNDLATTDPEIAAEWDYELNGDTIPQNVFRSSKKYYWWKCEHGHSWKAKVSERTIDKIPCRKCETEFVAILPHLLTLLYAGHRGMHVVFNSDQVTGIPTEMFIPELSLVIERYKKTQEQEVQSHICKANGIEFVTYTDSETAEEVVKKIRSILRVQHIYIKSNASEDIQLCREKYNILTEPSRLQRQGCKE